MVNWEQYLPVRPEKEEAMKRKKKDLPQNETAKQESGQTNKKISGWKLALVITASVVLLLSLTIAIWWSIIGVESFDEGIQAIVNIFVPPENNVFYKKSYSVSDKKAMNKHDTVVATVGGEELTNGELQIYYWMHVYDFLENNGYYAAYMGLDYAQPLDEQQCPDIEGTWQQYFLQDALTGWHTYQAMALMAEKQGIKLDESMQKSLDDLRMNMATSAVQGGFSSIEELVQSDMGPGATFDDYYNYTKTYYTGYMYYSQVYNAVDTSNAILEAYFKAHEEELKKSGVTKDSGNLFDVRHILIGIEGGTKGEDGKTTYSDAEWEACREKAQKLLDEWLAGEHTEETFGELAKKNSTDGGSKENGGLYTGLDKNTKFVKEFVDWYMAEGRQVGDYGLIKTDYGYHIMYCSKIEAQWIAACRAAVQSEEASKILKDAREAYPMEVTYKNIVLGVVDLAKEK